MADRRPAEDQADGGRGLLGGWFGRRSGKAGAASAAPGTTSLQRLEAALDQHPDAFCTLAPETDAQGNVNDYRVVYCNVAFQRLWQDSGHAQAGALLSAVLPPALARALLPQYSAVMLRGETLLEERERLAGASGPQWLRHHVVPAGDGIAVMLRDVSEQRRAEERVRQMTPYDLVTGLPNLLTFRDRLEHALQRSRRVQRAFGLLVLDLGGLERVVQAQGEEVGNTAIKQLAVRLRRALRDSDTLGRVGPARFMVILEDERGLTGADTVARTLMKVATTPLDLGGTPVQLTACIGTTLWSDERHGTGDLVAQAEAAQQLARRSGPNQHAAWSPELAARPAD